MFNGPCSGDVSGTAPCLWLIQDLSVRSSEALDFRFLPFITWRRMKLLEVALGLMLAGSVLRMNGSDADDDGKLRNALSFLSAAGVRRFRSDIFACRLHAIAESLILGTSDVVEPMYFGSIDRRWNL